MAFLVAALEPKMIDRIKIMVYEYAYLATLIARGMGLV